MLIFDTEAGGGIRIAPSRLRRGEIVAEVMSEPDLSPPERCALLEDLFAHRDVAQLAEARAAFAEGC